MKKLILILVPSVFFIFIYSPDLISGPYIKIEKIDVLSSFPRVKVYIAARGGSKTIPLNDRNFSIYQDGELVKGPVSIFEQAGAGDQSRLVISIDSSRSISKKFMADIKSAALHIVKHKGTEDKISVCHFDDDVTLLNDFSGDESVLSENIDSIKRHGKKTLLYNAINDSIDSFDKNKRSNDRIVVLTDGKDEGSGLTAEDIIQSARGAGVPIFFICDRITEESRAMERIAMLTNGKLAYYANRTCVEKLYKEIRETKRHFYEASYKTDLIPDDKKHNIEVRLKQGTIRDKDSLYVKLMAEPKKADFYTSDRFIMAGIISLLCIALLWVVILFLYKEKKMLKDKCRIEKHLLEESLKHADTADMNEAALYREQASAGSDISGPRYSRAWLFQKEVPGKGKKFLVNAPEVTVGSGKNSDIQIQDETVSSLHTKLKYVNGAYHLFDLMSEDGTFLNGKKLLRPKQLHDWDEIKLGTTVLIFRDV